MGVVLTECMSSSNLKGSTSTEETEHASSSAENESTHSVSDNARNRSNSISESNDTRDRMRRAMMADQRFTAIHHLLDAAPVLEASLSKATVVGERLWTSDNFSPDMNESWKDSALEMWDTSAPSLGAERGLNEAAKHFGDSLKWNESGNSGDSNGFDFDDLAWEEELGHESKTDAFENNEQSFGPAENLMHQSMPILLPREAEAWQSPEPTGGGLFDLPFNSTNADAGFDPFDGAGQATKSEIIHKPVADAGKLSPAPMKIKDAKMKAASMHERRSVSVQKTSASTARKPVGKQRSGSSHRKGLCDNGSHPKSPAGSHPSAPGRSESSSHPKTPKSTSDTGSHPMSSTDGNEPPTRRKTRRKASDSSNRVSPMRKSSDVSRKSPGRKPSGRTMPVRKPSGEVAGDCAPPPRRRSSINAEPAVSTRGRRTTSIRSPRRVSRRASAPKIDAGSFSQQLELLIAQTAKKKPRGEERETAVRGERRVRRSDKERKERERKVSGDRARSSDPSRRQRRTRSSEHRRARSDHRRASDFQSSAHRRSSTGAALHSKERRRASTTEVQPPRRLSATGMLKAELKAELNNEMKPSSRSRGERRGDSKPSIRAGTSGELSALAQTSTERKHNTGDVHDTLTVRRARRKIGVDLSVSRRSSSLHGRSSSQRAARSTAAKRGDSQHGRRRRSEIRPQEFKTHRDLDNAEKLAKDAMIDNGVERASQRAPSRPRDSERRARRSSTTGIRNRDARLRRSSAVS